MEWSILEHLAEDERRAVLGSCARSRFAKGEPIFRAGDMGDCLHLLASGTAAVRVSTPRGDVATIDVLRPGDAFGEQALLSDDSIRSATVSALEPVATLRLTRSGFVETVTRHPSTMDLLARILEARLRATTMDLVDALYAPVETRVFRRLARLSLIYGSGQAIPLTQDDVASMAGTTRQTLNKILRTAQDDGLLTLARGRISVVDPSGVARRAR